MVAFFNSFFFDTQGRVSFGKMIESYIDLKGYKSIVITDADGNDADLSDISANAVLDVARALDGKRIKIIIKGEKIEGVVESIESDDEKTVYVIGKTAYESCVQYKNMSAPQFNFRKKNCS